MSNWERRRPVIAVTAPSEATCLEGGWGSTRNIGKAPSGPHKIFNAFITTCHLSAINEKLERSHMNTLNPWPSRSCHNPGFLRTDAQLMPSVSFQEIASLLQVTPTSAWPSSHLSTCAPPPSSGQSPLVYSQPLHTQHLSIRAAVSLASSVLVSQDNGEVS